MKLHRFYVERDLPRSLWIHDQPLRNQWLKVLRLNRGSEFVLFNHEGQERLYRLDQIDDQGVHITMVTDMQPTIVNHHVHLLWSMLKRENNELVIQKATELGIRVLVPIVSERTVKTGFDTTRLRRIMIEAAEQCGRSDIPILHDPMKLAAAIHTFQEHCYLVAADQNGDQTLANVVRDHPNNCGIFVGPEGGWSQGDLAVFDNESVPLVRMSPLVLRAETAAITAAATACAHISI